MSMMTDDAKTYAEVLTNTINDLPAVVQAAVAEGRVSLVLDWMSFDVGGAFEIRPRVSLHPNGLAGLR
jgi:hypothetical protein